MPDWDELGFNDFIFTMATGPMLSGELSYR